MRRTALTCVLVLVLGIGLSGIETAGAQETTPRVIHPPMPVPEMPVPEESRPAGPAPGLTTPAAPPLAEPVPLAPPLTTGFPGLGDNICTLSTGCIIPPDTHGAAGPNHLMEVLNTEVWVQPRGPGPPLWGPVTLNDFWAPVNPPTPPETSPDGAFDPRVQYDPFADRWITVACDENPFTGVPDESAVMVGVSVTGDPTGAWYRWRFDVDPSNQVWADYPTVGFNDKWVVVQVNLFPVSGGLLDSSQIWVFDKTQLYANNFTPAGNFRITGHGGTQVPATTYDPLEPDLYLLQRWNGNSGGLGYLRLYRITGPANAPVLEWLNPDWHWVISPDPWSGSATGNPPIDFAPQIEPPGAVDGCTNCSPGTCLIQANDDRIQNVVMRNGILWATQAVFLPAVAIPSRSSVQWWQIDLNPTTVLQRGRVDDPTGSRFFAFPSIAVNKHEDVLLGYSSFEGTQYASGSYSFRTFFDPPDTMQPESPLHDGDACYYKDLNQGRNRWGDYSATVVDPDDTKLWTLQEYATFSNPLEFAEYRDKWGTWWGMLDTTRTISIADVSQPEGDLGTTPFTFTLTLSAPTPLEVKVPWNTNDGTATVFDGDYAPVAGGLVTFAPGETTQMLTVNVNGDIKWEPNETFVVDLSAPTNATLADNQATGTILNDDPLPQISIGDVQEVEGSTGLPDTTDFVFTVSLSNPSASGLSVDWATADGSAAAGPIGIGDFTAASGPLNVPPNTLTANVTVKVHGDLAVEPDEVFYVDLTNPLGGTLLKDRGVGTIIDDDAVNPAPVALTIVADSIGSGPTDGRTLLEWLNPANADGFLVKWNGESQCPAPANPGDASDGFTDDNNPITAGDVTKVSYSSLSAPPSPLNLGERYCYTVWLKYGAAFSPGRSLDARPYDSVATRVKWKVFSGMTLLAQPTVGFNAVVASGNDGFLHATSRSASGGPWPVPWRPRNLGSISQQRNPIVPLAGGWRIFVATQDGRVHAVDTANGNLIWSTQLPEGAAQGAPAGIFTAFGGAYDYILVGTSSGTNDRLYALDPFNGAVIDAFPQPGTEGFVGMGAVNGMPAVDYANRRVYFASWKGAVGGTIWCLKLGPPSDALSLDWRFNGPNDVNGSVVLHNQHVYVGDALDTVWSIPEAGPPGYFLSLADGEPKGFLFPDRRGNDLYVATSGNVWAITDDGSALNTSKWAAPAALTNPSVVLHHPGTDDIYVGVEDYGGTAAVVKIDAATGTIISSVPLESGPLTIGPPSLDLGYGMLHMGSVAGILYAVELGF